MTTLQTILLATTGNALLLSVLGWLARSLVQNILAKDIDEHRIRLEAQNEQAALAFGHELSLAAKEHDICFGRLHERRAETIAKLYELLVETSDKGVLYSSPYGTSNDAPKPEQFNEFAASYNNAAGFFYKNKLFLPADTCAKVEELFHGLKQHPSKMNIYMGMAERYPDSGMEVKMHGAWSDAWRYFESEFKPAMDSLERDLRKLLGDKTAEMS